MSPFHQFDAMWRQERSNNPKGPCSLLQFHTNGTRIRLALCYKPGPHGFLRHLSIAGPLRSPALPAGGSLAQFLGVLRRSPPRDVSNSARGSDQSSPPRVQRLKHGLNFSHDHAIPPCSDTRCPTRVLCTSHFLTARARPYRQGHRAVAPTRQPSPLLPSLPAMTSFCLTALHRVPDARADGEATRRSRTHPHVVALRDNREAKKR